MQFIQGVASKQGVAAVQPRALAILHHRNLRLGLLHAGGRRRLVQQAKHRPPRTGVGHQAHIAPGQWNAVAAIHRAQVAGGVRVEEMPMPVRRHGRHAAHDQRRGHPELVAGGDAVRLADQETPKRGAGAQQRTGKETALEIAPGIQHILRTHAGRGAGRFAVAGMNGAARGRRYAVAGMNGAMRGNGAVAVVQNLVADKEGQLVFQPLLLVAQTLVDQHRPGCFELRSHQRPARLAGIAVEPLHVERVPLADRHYGIEVERHLPLAALLGCPLDVREIVVARFLPDTDQ